MSKIKVRIIFAIVLIILILTAFFGTVILSYYNNQLKGLPVATSGVMDCKQHSINVNEKFYLDGEWEFYYNQFIYSDSVQLNKDCQYIKIGSSWTNLTDQEGKHYEAGGYGSYRLKINNYCYNSVMVIDIMNPKCAFKIFVNGILVNSNGTISKSKNDTISFSSLVWSEVPFFKTMTDDLDIIIEVSSQFNGGLDQVPYMLANGVYKNKSILSMLWVWIYFGVILAFTIIALLKTISEEEKNKNGALFVLTLAIVVKTIFSTQIFSIFQYRVIVINYEIISILVTVLTNILLIAFTLYFYHIKKGLNDELKKPFYVFGYILSILLIIIGVITNHLPQLIYWSYIVMIISTLVLLFFILKNFILYYNQYSVYFFLIAFLGSFVILLTTIEESGNIKYSLIHFYYLIVIFCLGTTILISSLKYRRAIKANEENKDLLHKLAEAQNALLFSQMKPHFIYNALNSIKYLVMTSPDEAEEAIDIFSKYLRTNMNMLEKKDNITFEQELTHTKHYVEIEILRFGEILKVEYNIKCQDFYIPPLTLQPIVENAIKHGVMKKTTGGKVIISTFEDNENDYIKVEDDGVGFNVNTLDTVENSFGIKNISSRLIKMVRGTIKIESQIGKGTIVIVTIPKID